MPGSAAARSLYQSGAPIQRDDEFHPPTSSVDLPGRIKQPDINSIAGWASMLLNGAQNPAFEPKVVILSRGSEWPGVVFVATSKAVAAGYLGARRFGLKRWEVELGTAEAELGANTGTNFIIDRFDDAGEVVRPSAMVINRATGVTTFSSLAGSSITLDPLPPNAVDDVAAAAAGVEVGKLYRNGSALMVRAV